MRFFSSPQKEIYNGNVNPIDIDHAMMKEKDVQKHFLWIILENIN